MNQDKVPPPPSASRIMEIANGFMPAAALFSAIEIGLFDALEAHGAQTVDKLTGKTACHPASLEMLLNALAAIALVRKQGDVYENSEEASTYLTSRSPLSLAAAIQYNQTVFPHWSRLTERLKTGRPVVANRDHLGSDPEATRRFVYSMHHKAKAIGKGILPFVDLSNTKHVLDVGGGPGTLAHLLAEKFPETSITVIDLPAVTEIGQSLHAHSPQNLQVTYRPGDYRTIDFPPAVDAVLFFGMFHQENEETIRLLLQKAFRALNSGGAVVVIDMMTDANGTSPTFSTLFGLNMSLTMENGWVFTTTALENWLVDAGFQQSHVDKLPPPQPHTLVSARKP